jgi:hypothetical protein
MGTTMTATMQDNGGHDGNSSKRQRPGTMVGAAADDNEHQDQDQDEEDNEEDNNGG